MNFTEEETCVLNKIVDYIMDLPLGTVTTTRRVMNEVFPELQEDAHRRDKGFMGILFVEWHFAIFNEVSSRGRTFDFSAHEDKLEGLSCNIEFVLR